MRISRVLAVIFMILSFTLVSHLPAKAATVSDCQVLIVQAKTDLNSSNVVIGGGHPEQTLASLNSKLTDASTKLDEGKFQDALNKLMDFRKQVQDLANAPKPKLNQDGATLLTNDVDAAIGCVQDLINNP